MEFLIDLLNFRNKLSERKLKALLIYVLVGILLVSATFGKNRIDFETIAVSSNEQLIACFETGSEHGSRIRCFRTDASHAFDYNIQSDISAGGHCTLWFEDDILCVQFYRTNKLVRLLADGTILEVGEASAKSPPPLFQNFTKEGHKYTYTGNLIDVVYDKKSVLSYWFFGADRNLAIITKSGEKTLICSWTSTS